MQPRYDTPAVSAGGPGALFRTIAGLDVSHVPESPDQPEVDFVLTVGQRSIPVEVKDQRRIDPLRHTEGLRTFLEKAANQAPFGVLVTLGDNSAVTDPRIVSPAAFHRDAAPVEPRDMQKPPQRAAQGVCKVIRKKSR